MKSWSTWGRLGVWIAISACGHSEPFGNQQYGSDQPFDPSPPIRLTLNRGADRRAAWLPDGSGIVYSTQRPGTRDNDVCLAVLPAGGGRQSSVTCNIAPTGDQITEALEPGAPASDGRLAFLLGQSGIGALVPVTQSLALGTLQSPTSYRVLLSLPYPGSTGQIVGGLSDLQWLGANRLLYLAELAIIRRPCQGCEYDTVRSGLEIASLPVDQTSPAPAAEVVPGTELASGVSPGGTENVIYYTLGGDTRVYHRDLSTGEVSVVYDFGVGGIARDVHVVGNRLAAVVGGRVAFAQDSTLGTIQWDSGGTLHVVDLQNGSDQIVNGPGLFRRPRLSPNATQVVAEVYPLIVSLLGGVADTTVAKVGDLYLFGPP